MGLSMLEKWADRNPIRFKGKWRVPPVPGQTGARQQPRHEAGCLGNSSAGKALESWQAPSWVWASSVLLWWKTKLQQNFRQHAERRDLLLFGIWENLSSALCSVLSNPVQGGAPCCCTGASWQAVHQKDEGAEMQDVSRKLELEPG